HAHLAHLAAGHLQFQGQHAAAGLDGQHRLAGDAVVVDELGYTADPISAHLRLAAVGVEHAHARVGPLRGTDEDKAVAADAEVPVADGATEGRGVLRRRIADAIHVNVVIADAVHLRKFHLYSHSMVAGGLLVTS